MSFELKISFATKAELVAFLTGTDPGKVQAGWEHKAARIDAEIRQAEAIKTDGQVDKAEVKKQTEERMKAEKAEAKKPEVTTSSPKQDESVASGETVDYPTLQAAVFKAAKINKTATLAVASELGSATFKELAPELWGTALAKVQALIDQAEVA